MLDAVNLAELADARQMVYSFLLRALSGPTPQQHAWLMSESFRTTLATIGETFGLGCPDGRLVPEQYEDHQSRYIACFEVGLPSPPVPLLASHYNRREPVPRILHEHILFYRRFGVSVPAGSLDPADHVVHQLAFLNHLDRLLVEGRVDPNSIAHARGDFLARHMLKWTRAAAELAQERHLPPVYRALLSLLAEAIEQDSELNTQYRSRHERTSDALA